jgi:hypothetical protein
VPASASIWVWCGDNLLTKEGVAIGADDVVDAAVDLAASRARAHAGGPPSEAQVTEWLQEGIAKAIARFVLGRMDRMKERLAIMSRTPLPSRDEIAALRRENEREQAEMEKLIGKSDGAADLPTAIVRDD